MLVKLYGSWTGWKAKVIVDMAGCGVFYTIWPGWQEGCTRRTEDRLCRYFDRNLQGGEQGRMGLTYAELGGVVKVER